MADFYISTEATQITGSFGGDYSIGARSELLCQQLTLLVKVEMYIIVKLAC